MDLASGWHPLADVLVEGEEGVGRGGGWAADHHVLDGASRGCLVGGECGGGGGGGGGWTGCGWVGGCVWGVWMWEGYTC